MSTNNITRISTPVAGEMLLNDSRNDLGFLALNIFHGQANIALFDAESERKFSSVSLHGVAEHSVVEHAGYTTITVRTNDGYSFTLSLHE